MNTLYYGLKVLRDYMKDVSVDLIYLDPSYRNRNYNVLFRNEAGTEARAFTTRPAGTKTTRACRYLPSRIFLLAKPSISRRTCRHTNRLRQRKPLAPTRNWNRFSRCRICIPSGTSFSFKYSHFGAILSFPITTCSSFVSLCNNRILKARFLMDLIQMKIIPCPHKNQNPLKMSWLF